MNGRRAAYQGRQTAHLLRQWAPSGRTATHLGERSKPSTFTRLRALLPKISAAVCGFQENRGISAEVPLHKQMGATAAAPICWFALAVPLRDEDALAAHRAVAEVLAFVGLRVPGEPRML